MRTEYVDTYETPSGFWHATTLEPVTPITAVGQSEAEALANLCGELIEHLDDWVEGREYTL